MKKVILGALLIVLSTVTFAQTAPKKEESKEKWVITMTTQERDAILKMIDTAGVTLNNSDVKSVDRVKTVNYLNSILQYFVSQFKTQNQPATEPKK